METLGSQDGTIARYTGSRVVDQSWGTKRPGRSCQRHPLVQVVEALPPRVMAGVSGGMDSRALLHALACAGKEVIVVHWDHAWRTDSWQDREWVEKLASGYGFPCLWERACSSGKRSEAEARKERWAFFLRASQQCGCSELVLAHHADDQVETVLFRLFRGTAGGAGGMRARSRQNGLTVHRPWLGFWKEDIFQYACREGLQWREDSSNEELRYVRNRLRRELFPWVERNLRLPARRSLLRFAQIQQELVDWLDVVVAPHVENPVLNVATLRALPVAVARHLVFRWLQSRGVHDIGFDEVEGVRHLADPGAASRCNLPCGWHARRRAGNIVVETR